MLGSGSIHLAADHGVCKSATKLKAHENTQAVTSALSHPVRNGTGKQKRALAGRMKRTYSCSSLKLLCSL